MDPKRLILGYLSAAPADAGQVQLLLKVGEVMGISGNSIRVALARMKRKGLVECTARGVYALGPAAAPTDRRVKMWKKASDMTVPWSDNRDMWLVVPTGLVDRERGQLQRTIRALKLMGFRGSGRDLYIRPANLVMNEYQLAATLRSLGASEDVWPIGPTKLVNAHPAKAFHEWDCHGLNKSYAEWLVELDATWRHLKEMGIYESAAKAFEVGDRAIRAIVADPLLPETMVDVVLRERFFEKMRYFDGLGHFLWRRVMLPDRYGHLEDHATPWL